MDDASRDAGIGAWVDHLLSDPVMLSMGHNQRGSDANLGLGWLYYALGRFVHPRRAVVIGSYRGYVPLILGKALQDNNEDGDVTFIDPSLVDDFWTDATTVREHFQANGVHNIRHFLMTTQQFVETAAYDALDDIGILFVDGFHTAAQARFDFEAFVDKLAPRGLALFHDSLVARESKFYGDDKIYEVNVRVYMDVLKGDPGFQVLDIPFATGLTIVRKVGDPPCEPLLEGRQAPPKG